MSRAANAGLPGRGPWKILAKCPSLLHNSTHAALKGLPESRCICPRALELKRRNYSPKSGTGQAAEAMLLAAYFAKHPKQYARNRDPLQSYMKNHRSAVPPSPDLRNAACRTKEGMKVMDALLDSNGNRSRKQLAIKELCSSCPLSAFTACDEYVQKNEFPAGSWAGVWAGRTQSERAGRSRARGAA